MNSINDSSNDRATVRALIAEDEPILAAALAHALRRLWPELAIVASCANGIDALAQAQALRPDILFLDIKMPGKSGLEAAEELAESWPPALVFPQLVFVTAYDEFAVAAFEQAAADYVLKPVNDSRLAKTVARLHQRLAGSAAAPATIGGSGGSGEGPNNGAPARPGDVPQNLALLLAQLQGQLQGLSAAPVERLAVIRAAVGNQVRLIPIGDVVYFEALDKYVNVVTQDNEALIRTSLKELLPQLDARQFWQIHRGTIVNAERIASATRDEAAKLSLQLKGRSEQLRVSPLYAHLFRQM
jgi:DNA-binding LytR/AlgR family response regulator